MQTKRISHELLAVFDLLKRARATGRVLDSDDMLGIMSAEADKFTFVIARRFENWLYKPTEEKHSDRPQKRSRSESECYYSSQR